MSLETLSALESIHIAEVSLPAPWSLPLSILLRGQRVLTAEDCITRVSHLLDSVFSQSIGGTLQEGQGKRRKRIIHLFLISPLHQYWISGSSWDAPQPPLCSAALWQPQLQRSLGSAVSLFPPSSFSPLRLLVLLVSGFLNIPYPFNISTFGPTEKNSVLCWNPKY